MIRNNKILEDFNRGYVRQKHYSYAQRLEIYEALLREALRLKKMPKDHLENIGGCLRMARILNSYK